MPSGRVILCLQRDAHVAPLLPLLRWLRAAGVAVAAPSPGLWRRGTGIEAIAEKLDLSLEGIEWKRRLEIEVSDLLLGTTDDLDALLRAQARSEARFVAVARLPLPATLLSAPAPRSLARAIEEDARRPEGRALTAGDPEALVALASRTRGLPFLLTGCPELSRPVAPPAADALVLLFPGDLRLAGTPASETVVLQERLLERVLTPLSAAGLPIEVSVPVGAEPRQDAESLRPLVERVGRLLSFGNGSLRVCERASTAGLSTAAAVLTLCESDLLSALVAGAERSWRLGFALAADLPLPPADPALDCVIPTTAALGEWIAAEGWNAPTEGAKRVSAAFAPLTTPRTPERIAQAILSSAAEW